MSFLLRTLRESVSTKHHTRQGELIVFLFFLFHSHTCEHLNLVSLSLSLRITVIDRSRVCECNSIEHTRTKRSCRLIYMAHVMIYGSGKHAPMANVFWVCSIMQSSAAWLALLTLNLLTLVPCSCLFDPRIRVSI